MRGVQITLPSLTMQSPFPAIDTRAKNSIMFSTVATPLMNTKKMIHKRATMRRMKKKVNLTMSANSTVVLLDDVLGMVSVVSGSSAGSEDCLVVHLAVRKFLMAFTASKQTSL